MVHVKVALWESSDEEEQELNDGSGFGGMKAPARRDIAGVNASTRTGFAAMEETRVDGMHDGGWEEEEREREAEEARQRQQQQQQQEDDEEDPNASKWDPRWDEVDGDIMNGGGVMGGEVGGDDTVMVPSSQQVEDDEDEAGYGGAGAPIPLPGQLGLNARKLHLMNASLFGSGAGDEPLPAMDTADEVEMFREQRLQREQTIAEARAAGAGDVVAAAAAAAAAASPAPTAVVAEVLPRGAEFGTPLAVWNEDAQPPQPQLRDSRLGMRCAFRVSWGPGGTLTYPGMGRTVVVAKIDSGDAGREASRARIEGALRVHRKHYSAQVQAHLQQQQQQMQMQQIDQEQPDVRQVQPLCDAHLGELASMPAAQEDSSSASSFHRSLWGLVRALWAANKGRAAIPRTPGCQQDDSLPEYTEQFARREALSAWLQASVSAEVGDHVRNASSSAMDQVTALLTGNKIEEACQVASEAGDYHLAILLTMAGQSNQGEACVQAREDLAKQIESWQASGAWDLFDDARKRVYELMSGRLDRLSMWNQQGRERVMAQDMSWLRWLGLQLWLGPRCGSVQNASVSNVVANYAQAFARDDQAYRAEAAAVPPLPLCLDGAARPFSDPRANTLYDLRFSLMQLYCDPSRRLSTVLSPESYSADPLDHSLAWHVHDVLRHTQALRGNHNNGNAHVHQLYMSFAAQLESLGLWQWAVYVVMFSRTAGAGTGVYLDCERVVKDILFRRAEELGEYNDASRWHPHGWGRRATDTPYELVSSVTALKGVGGANQPMQAFLLSVGVEQAWIEEARACFAGYCGDQGQRLESLLAARQLERAHEVLLRDIAPQCILSGGAEDIRELNATLQRLHALGGDGSRIREWAMGGGLLLSFTNLKKNFATVADFKLRTADMQQLAASGVWEELEAMLHLAIQAASETASDEPQSVLSRACLSEMAAQCALMLAGRQPDPVHAAMNKLPRVLKDNHALDQLDRVCWQLASTACAT